MQGISNAIGKSGGILTQATLLASGWSDGQQTVKVKPVLGTPDKQLVIAVANAENEDMYDQYVDNGVRAIAEGVGTLTFSCKSVPETDILVDIAVLDAKSEE